MYDNGRESKEAGWEGAYVDVGGFTQTVYQ